MSKIINMIPCIEMLDGFKHICVDEAQRISTTFKLVGEGEREREKEREKKREIKEYSFE